jgi:hypothetical protein
VGIDFSSQSFEFPAVPAASVFDDCFAMMGAHRTWADAQMPQQARHAERQKATAAIHAADACQQKPG